MAKPPLNPVTDSDVAAFSRYMRKWQRVLGLNDWRVEPASTRTKAMAEVNLDVPARLASYRVGKDFGSAKVTPQSLDATACHEMIHVLLAEFKAVCMARASDYDAIETAEHRVVHTLEKLLMKEAE